MCECVWECVCAAHPCCYFYTIWRWLAYASWAALLLGVSRVSCSSCFLILFASFHGPNRYICMPHVCTGTVTVIHEGVRNKYNGTEWYTSCISFYWFYFTQLFLNYTISFIYLTSPDYSLHVLYPSFVTLRPTIP